MRDRLLHIIAASCQYITLRVPESMYQSIITQEYKELEIILVDDGSRWLPTAVPINGRNKINGSE